MELVPNLAAPPYRTASAEVSNGKLAVTDTHRVGGAESPVSKCFELFELDGKVGFAFLQFAFIIKLKTRILSSFLK